MAYSPSRLCWKAVSITLAIYQEVKEAHHEGMTFGEYLRESKDPTAKTVLFEDSAALTRDRDRRLTGLVLTEYQVGGAAGAYWDGVASILDRFGAGRCGFCLCAFFARSVAWRSGQSQRQ